MRLIYYRGSVPNFGDEINADIWPFLAPELFRRDDGTGLLGIGTIIGITPPQISHLHVFTSGAGYDDLRQWQVPHTYWCVRGPLTAALVGAPADIALGDGAILAPLVPGYPERASGTGGTLVIPHWQSLDYPGWAEAAAMIGAELLDPRAEPLGVVRRIAAAKLVITESLHGAILADTYGIPWISYASSGNYSQFKWRDWTAAMRLPLRFVPVIPPHPGGLLTYGRLRYRPGEPVTIDDDAARSDYDQHFPETHAVPSLMGRMRQGVRQGVRQWLLSNTAGQRVLGCCPERTAEILWLARTQEPQLSAPSLRDSHRNRILDKLEQVRRLA